ncbi:MAG: hypothetical protein AAGH87_01145 [Pseudomonadota bacterium]
MARTLVIQLTLFLLPFLGYAFYRLLLSDAQTDGRKTWPIRVLFASGAALMAAGFAYLALSEERSPNLCHEPARYVDGVLVQARSVPCERDLTNVGAPAGDTSGPSQSAPEIVSPGAEDQSGTGGN